MFCSIFFSFILVILAIFLGIAGIVFFVLGLIESKQKKWIPGIIAVFLALIIAIFSIVSGFSRLIKKISKIDNNYHFPTSIDTVTTSISLLDTVLYSKAVSGFITDNQNDLMLLKIYPHKNLIDKRIKITEFTGNSSKTLVSPTIQISVGFDTLYTGKLNLSLYSEKKVLLGESTVLISGNKGETVRSVFMFPQHVTFSEVNYGTISINP